MKRQNFRVPLVFSGLFIITMLAAGMAIFFQPAFPRIPLFKVSQDHTVRQNAPLKGHWLMTDKDRSYNPPALFTGQNRIKGVSGPAPVLTMEAAKSRFNRLADSINIMYIWTDQERLRVISITSFNKTSKQACVVVVPLYTVTEGGTRAVLDHDHRTIQDLYRTQGREGVRRYFEQEFEIKIPNFVHVNQTALQKVSEIVGVLKVNGDDVTMLEALEQTEAGIRTDDRDVVRAVAAQILRPRMILEVPKLLWIFTHDIKTNFTTEQMVTLFHFSRQMDLGHMRKTGLPGYEHLWGGNKYLFVSDQTWKNLIYEITQ